MKVIDRRASDNKYLHRDFHISMNMLMGYIVAEYNEEALIEYLKNFAKAYHAPLKKALIDTGLTAMEEYLAEIYEKEEWPVDISLANDVFTVSQKACPGISHIVNKGHEPIVQYIYTYTIVYETICEGTPYEYQMENFDQKTGACRQIFRRRSV